MGRQAEILGRDELLYGLIKPPWFEGDCSIPTKIGKRVFNAKLAKDACEIHDWTFLLISILYEPKTVQWHMAIHQADAQLRWNLVLMRKRYAVGRIWGWMYYRGLRLPFVGSRRAVNRHPRTHPRRPRGAKQIAECMEAAKQYNGGELTDFARSVFLSYTQESK